jgi:SAM-dependent methyltransferase
MTDRFDKDFWEQHWHRGRDGGPGSMAGNPPNPYLVRELGGLGPGTALDAGCGVGAEAIWLAATGWRVTAVDISSEALARARERAAGSGVGDRVQWVETDLSSWTPGTGYDLVTTHYAHPAIPQLDFYDRIAAWVVPGGTLLIVGHGPATGSAGRGHGHGAEHGPETAAATSVTAAAVVARLEDATWDIVTADEPHRTLSGPGGRQVTLHDVVVRATRLPDRNP